MSRMLPELVDVQGKDAQETVEPIQVSCTCYTMLAEKNNPLIRNASIVIWAVSKMGVAQQWMIYPITMDDLGLPP